MRKLISIFAFVLTCAHGFCMVAEPGLPECSLISQDSDGNSLPAEWFQTIQPDLLHLIKRSYVVTKRSQEEEFLHLRDMLSGQKKYTILETKHKWLCRRNFTGVHGKIEKTSCFRAMLNCCIKCGACGKFAAELDFPGFVAYMQPNEDCPYHVITVVFRGSQGEDFQPKSGMLGASWATNYDAVPLAVNAADYGYTGKVHAGYLTKFNYCNSTGGELMQLIEDGEIRSPLPFSYDMRIFNPLNTSIRKTINEIPEDERNKIRFVVTGHSQGGGLAQIALPYIVTQFGSSLPGFLNNNLTPRFFGYFLSSPRIVANMQSAQNYELLVGHDNMINHFAFRDVVTMACLTGYVTLGHMACDSVYDVVYRAICSEIAYNNRMLLMNFFKKNLDERDFNTKQNDLWFLRENADLVISWTDVKHVLSHISFGYDAITKEGITAMINKSLERYRKRNNIESTTQFTEDQINFLDDTNWGEIQRICRGDLFPEEINLDAKRRNIIKEIESNVLGDTVTFSQDGRYNVRALIDTALDLKDAGLGRSNPGGFLEILKRIFCCGSRSDGYDNIETSYIFDPEFKEMLEARGVSLEDFGLTPAGSLSLVAYLHYGSGANAYDSKLFDKFPPSRNLLLALRNGKIVERGRGFNLHSGCRQEPLLQNILEGNSDEEEINFNGNFLNNNAKILDSIPYP